MTISVRCRHCDRSLKVKDDYAGQTVKCPGCQSALKVPAIEEELDDFEEIVEESSPRPKPKRKSSSGELPVWVGYLKRFWFLAVPVVAIPIALFSGFAGGMLGLGAAVIGVLYMIVGFVPALLVAPVYSLVPLVRMTTPQKERERIWKQQAPHFAVFAKGLLILACGILSAFLSAKTADWSHRIGLNGRKGEMRGDRDHSRPFPAPNGEAPAVVVHPPLPSVEGQINSSLPTNPNQPAPPLSPNSDASAAQATNWIRRPVIPTSPGQAVMVNQSGEWIAGRVDIIYSNNTVDVTLTTGQVVRGVQFSELSAMAQRDVAMNGVPQTGTPEPSPFQEVNEPANSPQKAPNTSGIPLQISPEDFHFNIKAQSSFTQRFNASAKVGDSMILEVIGSRHGTCFGGKDRVYSTDSAISVAAVHAGLLKEGERGRIQITMVKSLPSYPSLTQNGIQSSSWHDTWPAIQISMGE